MIKLEKVSKSYGNNIVLDNIDLCLENNRIYGLIGRNGVGKTTLMKILSDQIVNYQGQIYYEGSNIKNNNLLKENIVYIGEDFLTYNLEAHKLIKIVEYIKYLYPHFNQDRFDELTKLFRIDLFDKYRKLSLGNQSLFRNIIALSLQAKFLLLDEPSVGLDEINRDMFYQKLLDYQEIDGSTIVISSHILSDIEKIVTDIVILNRGKIIVNDSINDILEKSIIITTNEDYIKYFENKNIIKKTYLGKQVILYAYDRFTDNEISTMREISDISRLNLKELFLALSKED
ncbi:ABC transporter ATP-binding protein [Anaerococcus sp. Marseille-Q7828]|uniref:ATP-binding cassette domain-containing protein n=1 Tax=Anaerococcus sp. Marseille-Q7828 TaxID=3036300 RepID=UPI0024AE7208|nr:ABC transporter ATP-binding protein [Anaerococcus sp. Marseille-Q7828]